MKYKYEHLVVAYGSNLNDEDWSNFCRRNGFSDNLLQFEGCVRLPDYALTFNHYSNSRGGGAVNIQPDIGHFVEAALFSTSEEGLQALRCKEGHPRVYLETHVIAIKDDGSEVNARTYIVPPNKGQKYERPTREYYEICKRGYENYGLCTKNLSLTASGQKHEPLSTIFTYGTLMRGQPRHDAIAKYERQNKNVELVLTGKVRGHLTTNGDFPGLDQSSDQTTHGDFLRVSNIKDVLETADRIEGFQSFGSPHNLFRRTLTYVCTGGFEPELAWVYAFDGHLGKRVPSNDWRVHTRCKLRFYWGLVETYGQYDPTFFERIDDRKTNAENIDTNFFSGLIQNLCFGKLLERDLAAAAGVYAIWPKEGLISENAEAFEKEFLTHLEYENDAFSRQKCYV